MRRRALAASLAAAAAALGAGCGGGDGGGDGEPTARAPWSIIEDHTPLIRSGERRRELTLKEMRDIGADTLRVALKWSEVAPRAESGRRPRFDASDPAAYPGFGPYDDLVRRATDRGFRVLLDLAPDAPRWATADGAPLGPETGNREPDPREFARFAAAAGERYSGDFEGLPKVEWFSLWNEPNHHFFLKPNRDAPRIYREMVTAALPALREAAGDVKVLVGETAPVRRPGTVLGPRDFLQRFLCLDDEFRPTARERGCRGFEGFEVDGYAHHPYGPASRRPTRADVISLLVMNRLVRYLDRAAAAGRVPRNLPIYSTEFGFQSNPPDPTARITLEEQAALLNEKEQESYRFGPRVRSYAQYLLYDDPAREGATQEQVWSGFQTGLRFADGAAKPAYRAYQFPIVVERSGSDSVAVWGRVRPGSGIRSVVLEHRRGGRFRPTGARLETDDAGYFDELLVLRPAAMRFRAFDAEGRRLGTSRIARPVKSSRD